MTLRAPSTCSSLRSSVAQNDSRMNVFLRVYLAPRLLLSVYTSPLTLHGFLFTPPHHSLPLLRISSRTEPPITRWVFGIYLLFCERSVRDSVRGHILPGRLMAGQRPLEPLVVVRIHPGQQWGMGEREHGRDVLLLSRARPLSVRDMPSHPSLHTSGSLWTHTRRRMHRDTTSLPHR